MSDTWGKGSVNNNIGWGQAAGSATNDWGKSQKESWAGQTDIVGITSVSITYSSSAFCSDANDPTPTISNNAGAGTFSSTAGLVFISTTTGEVDISGSTAGSYVITYTDTDAATATFDLSINTIPTVTVSASAGTICDGESTILTASGANSYTWSNGVTGASITVSPSTTTIFTATGTDSNSCTSSGGTTITVNALPSVSISGTLTYCSGASTTLDAGSFVSYLWSNGETTQTISATAGNYTVTVTDSNGCSNTSAQVAVSELALPTVAISGTLSYCAGSNTTLTATAGLNTYLWSSGETTQSITATAGSYTVTGTDANGCSNTSSSVTVTETALDNAAFSYSASSYEPTDADPTPTITGLTGGTFSGTTGLVINSTTGEIDLSASTVASHTITYDTTSSGSSVCPNTSTQTVDIALAGIANNYSMNFDSASGDYLQVSNTTDFDFGTGDFTWSLWINYETHVAYSGLLYTGASNSTYRLKFQTSGQILFMQNADGDSQVADLGTNITGTGWHHLCLVRSSGTITTYLDGSPVDTDSRAGNVNSNGNDLLIGKNGSGYFDGKMDELAIWNTALTSTQVSEIYNATDTNLTKDLTTVSGSNLIYWNRMGD
jgi:hypothetical protein